MKLNFKSILVYNTGGSASWGDGNVTSRTVLVIYAGAEWVLGGRVFHPSAHCFSRDILSQIISLYITLALFRILC